MAELLPESEVKELLGITDFRSIKKEQLVQFVSMIPQMDKEVAKACIAQFPNFKDYSSSIVNSLYSLLSSAMENDSIGSITAYNTILDTLREMLSRDSISEEERHYIIDKMVEVSSHISSVEDKKRDFKKSVIKIASAVGVFAMTLGGALLGLKVTKK